MSQNQPAVPPAQPPAAPSFEEQVHIFWTNNRRQIYFLCAAILFALIGKEGWRIYAEQREQDIARDYSHATTPEKLATFAADHPGHVLGAVAHLSLADQKYRAGDFKAAADFYQQAQVGLANEALLGRARLGAAMSRLNAGDTSAGEAALKSIGADTSAFKTVRAEAMYHLASLALEAGKTDETRRLLDEIARIDASGVWAQRAMVLRTTLPSESKPGSDASPVTFKPGKP